MRHPSIRSVYAYWSTLRAERPAPLRTEIDPRAIARELGDVFLLEGIADSMTFRLAGSRIVHALGDSLTGKSFLSLWETAAQTGASEALGTATLAELPMLLGISRADAETPTAPAAPKTPPATPGQSWLNHRPAPSLRRDRSPLADGAGELLLLPLRHPPAIGRRVMGALAFFNPPPLPAPQPVLLAMTGGRVLGRDAQPVRGSDLQPGFPPDRVGERRGHLFVMQGDRDRETRPN